MRHLFLVSAMGLTLLAGCGKAYKSANPLNDVVSAEGEASRKQMALAAPEAADKGGGKPGADEGEGAKPAAPLPRKIRKTGDIKIIVDDFDKAYRH